MRTTKADAVDTKWEVWQAEWQAELDAVNTKWLVKLDAVNTKWQAEVDAVDAKFNARRKRLPGP